MLCQGKALLQQGAGYKGCVKSPKKLRKFGYKDFSRRFLIEKMAFYTTPSRESRPARSKGIASLLNTPCKHSDPSGYKKYLKYV